MALIYVAKLWNCCFFVSLQCTIMWFRKHLWNPSCRTAWHKCYLQPKDLDMVDWALTAWQLRVFNSPWRILPWMVQIHCMSLVAQSFPTSYCNALTTCNWLWHLPFLTHTRLSTFLWCTAHFFTFSGLLNMKKKTYRPALYIKAAWYMSKEEPLNAKKSWPIWAEMYTVQCCTNIERRKSAICQTAYGCTVADELCCVTHISSWKTDHSLPALVNPLEITRYFHMEAVSVEVPYSLYVPCPARGLQNSISVATIFHRCSKKQHIFYTDGST